MLRFGVIESVDSKKIPYKHMSLRKMESFTVSIKYVSVLPCSQLSYHFPLISVDIL